MLRFVAIEKTWVHHFTPETVKTVNSNKENAFSVACIIFSHNQTRIDPRINISLRDATSHRHTSLALPTLEERRLDAFETKTIQIENFKFFAKLFCSLPGRSAISKGDMDKNVLTPICLCLHLHLLPEEQTNKSRKILKILFHFKSSF